MSSPASIFCKMLEIEYKAKIDAIESVLYLPLRAINDVKSNISRVEHITYLIVKAEVLKFEKIIIDILFLDKINSLEGIDNFCRVAFACEALVSLLTSESNHYTDFLDPTIKSQISTDYNLFEKHICKLGLRRLISDFTDAALDEIRSQLVILRTKLEDELRLDEIKATYIDILNTDIYGTKSILELLDDLRTFLNCGFGICDFAASSNNAINNYMRKLTLKDNGSTFENDVDSLLTDYETLNDEMTDKIDELLHLIDYRDFNRNTPLSDVMVI